MRRFAARGMNPHFLFGWRRYAPAGTAASLRATQEVAGATAEREAGQVGFAARCTAAVRRGLHACKFQQNRGTPRKPSEAVFVGRGERSGAVRALPFRRGECSAAFFDDNGGCNAHAANLRQQKRAGPFGPALQRFKKAQRTYLIRSPAASLALISFTASL